MLIPNGTGNVGIGTTSPQYPLHVAGSSSVTSPTGDGVLMGLYAGTYGHIQMNGSAGSYIDFSQSGVDHKGRILYDNGANYLRLDTNGTEKMRITSTGGISFGSTGTAYGVSGQILKSNGNASPTWIDGSAIPGVPAGSVTVNTIPLWTPDGDTLGNSIITQPTSAEVSVGGKLKVSSTVAGYSSTKIQTGGFGDSQSGINILNSTTGYGYILFGDGSGADLYRGQITYKHGDDFMAFNTAGSERMRVDSTGNVGIGTTSPEAKLE